MQVVSLSAFQQRRGETVWKIAEGVSSTLLWRQEAADRDFFDPSWPLRSPDSGSIPNFQTVSPGRWVHKGKKQGRGPGSLRRPRAPATSAGIVVEPPSALDAETSLVGVLAQQLTGTFRDAVAHGGVVLLDVKHYVQADAIHEAKGGHAGAGPDLPHGVDVLGRRDTLLDDHQALTLDRGPDAVEDEPVALAAHPEGHQSVLGDLLHKRVDDPLFGLATRHQLNRIEFGRLLIVCVQHALGMLDL